MNIRCNLYNESKNFRKAILKIKPEDFRFELLSEFPTNCCEFSSYLLAKYFKEVCRFKNIKLLTGENKFKTTQRHTWLNIQGFDIDITANQFLSTNKTVIVEFSSCWHKRYRLLKTETPDITFNQFHDDDKYDLLHDFDLILNELMKIKCNS